MHADRLGARLGLSGRTVEDVRRDLTTVHLLVREGQTRRVRWLVRLPPPCLPQTSRPTDAEILTLAAYLDSTLENGQSATEIPSQSTGNLEPIQDVIARSVAGNGASVGGGKGGRVPPLTRLVRAVPTSLTDLHSAVGGGSCSDEREAEGGKLQEITA